MKIRKFMLCGMPMVEIVNAKGKSVIITLYMYNLMRNKMISVINSVTGDERVNYMKVYHYKEL